MRRDDVARSYHQGCSGLPMINVKNHLWVPDLIRRYRGAQDTDLGDDEPFWEWVEAEYERQPGYPSMFDIADELARDDCWALAQEHAEDVWDRRSVEVEPAGRSGGWLVVRGLPGIDCWDAVDLGRWARFAKHVRLLADEEYPYLFVWHLHSLWEMNVDGPARDAERWIDALATLA